MGPAEVGEESLPRYEMMGEVFVTINLFSMIFFKSFHFEV